MTIPNCSIQITKTYQTINTYTIAWNTCHRFNSSLWHIMELIDTPQDTLSMSSPIQTQHHKNTYILQIKIMLLTFHTTKSTHDKHPKNNNIHPHTSKLSYSWEKTYNPTQIYLYKSSTTFQKSTTTTTTHYQLNLFIIALIPAPHQRNHQLFVHLHPRCIMA